MLGSSGNCSQGSNSVGMDLPRVSDANQCAYDAIGITGRHRLVTLLHVS
jgi:hypothetical protein